MTEPQSPAPVVSMLATKFRALEEDVRRSHFEREAIIHGFVLAMLIRRHILLIGPPGTDKSRLSRDMARRFGDLRFWETLVTRGSVPEQVFGPQSLKALEHDEYRRKVEGYLPDAEMALIDEIYKSNSFLLHMMLPVLNEGIFHNGAGAPTRVPLQMAIGASNEMPDDQEQLEALHDRFLLRFITEPLRDSRHFEQMITGGDTPSAPATVTRDELEAARQEVTQVSLDAVVSMVYTLRAQLQREGIIASDRRWKQAMELVRAEAWCQGRPAADVSDLAVLEHVLWERPGDRAKVSKTVLGMVSPYDQEAKDRLLDAQEAYETAINAPEAESTAKGLEAARTLKSAAKHLGDLLQRAQADGRSTLAIQDGLRQINDWNQEVARVCLGLD